MPPPILFNHPPSLSLSTRLKTGLDTFAEALAVTLGPLQGSVLVAPLLGTRVELLTDAGTLAQRLIALPHRAEHVGAMILRQAIIEQHQQLGDGAALTAVLAQAILKQAQPLLAAGHHPQSIQQALNAVLPPALATLKAQSRPLQHADALTQLAERLGCEPELSLILGEIFDLLGPEAYVRLQRYAAPYTEREYVAGGLWDAQLAARAFITDAPTGRAELNGCFVALSLAPLTTASTLAPLLNLVLAQSRQNLVLIAPRFEPPALQLLITNHHQSQLNILALTLNTLGQARRLDFEDLAALTGATLFSPETGRDLETVSLADLGLARRVEAHKTALVVLGGLHPQSQPRLQAQLQALHAQKQALTAKEAATQRLPLRLARLAGQTVILKIGAVTKTQLDWRYQQAEKALRTLPWAMRGGVVPGGGLAYLNCAQTLLSQPSSSTSKNANALGVRILSEALSAPAYRILHNAGLPAPAVTLAEARRRGPTVGLDVETRVMLDFHPAGIWDATEVLAQALERAVSCALSVLSLEVLVL